MPNGPDYKGAAAELNPFTPKSDQVRISPVASPVILHHTVWRTWLFIAYSDWKRILVPVLTISLIQFSWNGWENVLFELGIERVKHSLYCSWAQQGKQVIIGLRFPTNLNSDFDWHVFCSSFKSCSSRASRTAKAHGSKSTSVGETHNELRRFTIMSWFMRANALVKNASVAVWRLAMSTLFTGVARLLQEHPPPLTIIDPTPS